MSESVLMARRGRPLVIQLNCPSRTNVFTLEGDAQVALRWGLVRAPLHHEQLVDGALVIADHPVAPRQLGRSLFKEALGGTSKATLDRQLDAEHELQTLTIASPNYSEAFRVFVQSRTPAYAGTAS